MCPQLQLMISHVINHLKNFNCLSRRKHYKVNESAAYLDIVINKQGSSLSPDTVNILVCVRYWMKTLSITIIIIIVCVCLCVCV